MLAQLPTLRAFAVSLCGNLDRADDLVQEALLKAWKNLDMFEEGTNLRAWLFTILRNGYFSELRKRRREIEDVDGKMTASLSVRPAQHGHLDMQDFHKALSTLPADQREAWCSSARSGCPMKRQPEWLSAPSVPSRAGLTAPARSW